MTTDNVRPIIDVEDVALHASLLDMCARRAKVCVRFHVYRSPTIGCAVGMIGAVDHHVRLIVGNWAEKYNVPISEIVSVEELPT